MYAKASIATKSRELTVVNTAPVFDDVPTKHGRLVRLTCIVQTMHYRWSEDPLRQGDFGRDSWEARKVWKKDSSGDYDVEGSVLHVRGPWKERGTSGAITLNKTSPLGSLERDAVMALDDATTRLAQATYFNLRNGVEYTFRSLHKQSNATDTVDYKIRYFNGTIYRHWSGSAWQDAEAWLTLADAIVETQTNEEFTPEATARHEVVFKPTGAAASQTCQLANIYIAESALATDPLVPVDKNFVIRAEGEGRVSAILDAVGTADLTVSEVGS